MLMMKHLYTLIFLFTLAALPTQAADYAEPLALSETEQQPQVAAVGERAVRITNANGLTAYVYNVAGVCVQQWRVDGPDRRYDLNLPRGCYIVKVGKTVRKISIK